MVVVSHQQHCIDCPAHTFYFVPAGKHSAQQQKGQTVYSQCPTLPTCTAVHKQGHPACLSAATSTSTAVWLLCSMLQQLSTNEEAL
jgi:hypothetical protein